MKAIQVTRFGEPEAMRLSELPDLVPAPGTVVVRPHAISVNFTDLWARLGLPAFGVTPPFTPGMEVVGEIEAVGEGVAHELHPGQRVIGFTPATLGGYAEQVAVFARFVYPLPERIPFKDAATFVLNYLTAYASLRHMAQVRNHERVLIHGGGGGVGLAAIQLARLAYADIFATASRSKHEFLQAQGVHHAIDYRTQDFEQEVMRLTEGSGVDVVLDNIGGENLLKSYRVLRYGGRLVCYGSSGALVSKRTLQDRGLELIEPGSIRFADLEQDGRAVMGSGLADDETQLRAWLNDIFTLYLDGQIRPHIDQVFPLAEAVRAHHYLHDRQNVGKVLLVP